MNVVLGSVVAALLLLAQSGSQETTLFEKLTVIAEANKASYLELEPVQLLVTVRNPTPSPIVGVPSPFAAGVFVEVARGDEEFRTYHASWRPACGVPAPASNASIPAGYTGKEGLVVYYKTVDKDNIQTRIFPEPDRYRCRVRLRLGDREVVSNVVEIRVAKPSLPADVAVRDYLLGADLDLFLDGEARHHAVTDAALAGVEGVLKRFPKSSYEPYLCLGIGAVYFGRSSPGGQPGRLFDANGLKKAVEWCAAAAAAPGHPAADDAAYLAGKACTLLKRTRKAGEFLTQAEACGQERHAGDCKKLRESLKQLEAAGIKNED